jgi:hypothetical protein
MSGEIISGFKRVWFKFANYKMKPRDQKIFIEAAVLITIYFFSFLVLSMGRVQQEFFGISAGSFSSIQMIILTFIFAAVSAIILYYYIYKKVIRWVPV